MAEEFVSVVLPVYNREKTIGRAIDSVLCQTYASLELLVVDDGSTDNTLKIIQSYSDERIKLIRQERGGANKARNTGVVNATGAYIAFQDSDDEWCVDKLEVQIAFMQNKCCLACFSPYYLHERDSVSVMPGDYNTNEEYHYNLACILKRQNVVGTPTLLMKKEAVSLLKGEVFDETLPRFQDYELLIRLVQLGEIGYIEEPLVNAYKQEDNISGSRQNLYIAVGKLLKKHRDFLDISSFLNTYIYKGVEYEETSELIEGMRKMQDIVGTDFIDINKEMTIYLHSTFKTRSLVLEKIYQAALPSLHRKKFVIYGTGAVAREFYGRIRQKGIRPEGFIVTSVGKDDANIFDSILVSTAEDFVSRDILVVVCVSLKYQEAILDHLMNLGYSDICVYCAGNNG